MISFCCLDLTTTMSIIHRRVMIPRTMQITIALENTTKKKKKIK